MDDNSTLSLLVDQIRHSFSNFPDVSLLHLPRQFNTTAHFLARGDIRLRGDAIEDSESKTSFANERLHKKPLSK
ncbi:hypothetical protein F8388_025711 [Cannabis sativa]|uniref:RNase H type-1 domain-containing protein n=1 Tax=Cannabis sativa TaxID=3483 RepID=A0A7J6G437_CANSA|nr:hypothetical protein F8388_025711 [Cannabis sativa]